MILDRAFDGNVCRDIAEKDTMFEGNKSDEYFNAGRLALELCKAILGGRPVRRVIDFPSGYGRALRWFRAEWPEAEIIAVETDPNALAFVEATFKATTVQGHPSLDATIPGGADLIFSGSLLTHFDAWQWDKFLNLCIEALAPDGTFVFTTHGRVAALLAEQKHPIYGSLIDTKELYETYKEDGFAFIPYSADYPTFGLSLSSPSWIMSRLEKLPLVKIVAFEEQAWGQDVIAVRRNPWNMVR